MLFVNFQNLQERHSRKQEGHLPCHICERKRGEPDEGEREDYQKAGQPDRHPGDEGRQDRGVQTGGLRLRRFRPWILYHQVFRRDGELSGILTAAAGRMIYVKKPLEQIK